MDVRDRTLEEFLSATAAESVAPAGGTAAAVAGGVGASLCEMGYVHTLMDRPATEGEELAEARDELAGLREQLLLLGNADADLVDELFGSGDAETEAGNVDELVGSGDSITDAGLDDRLVGSSDIDIDADLVDNLVGTDGPGTDAGWKRAVGVPLATAEVCGDVLELAPLVVERDDTAAVSDVRTGVVLAHAALRASLFTVRSILNRVSDEAFVGAVDRRATAIETEASAAVDGALAGTDTLR